MALTKVANTLLDFTGGFVAGNVSFPAITTVGDTNTGIFFPAADTIAFAEGGAECARFDSSGNLGIGTTTPTTKLNVSSAGADVEVRASTTTSGNVRFGFDVDGAYYNWIQANRSSGAIQFAISNSEVMQINAAGGLKTSNTIGVGNATPSTSGAGITFPATQSASTDANTLDDYEEGTYTPTQANFSTTGTLTITGRYIKIGNIIHFSVFFSSTGTIGFSTSAFITTPFTVKQATGNITMRVNSNSVSFNGNQSGAQCNTDEVAQARFFVGNFTTTSTGQGLIFAGTFEQH